MATGSVPYHAYGAVNLTDTDGALDNIPSKKLQQNDVALVLQESEVYFFKLEKDSDKEHDVPYVIKPRDDTDGKRWLLVSQKYYTTDIVQLLENYIQTSHIKSIEGEDLVIESSSGQKVKIHPNGNVTFPSYVSADRFPLKDEHLTNKKYVDDNIENKKDDLIVYVDDEIGKLDTDLKTYIDEQIQLTEDEVVVYIDDHVDEIWIELNNLDSTITDLNDELIEYIDTEISDLEDRVKYRVDMTFDSKETDIKNYIDNDIDNLEGEVPYYIEKQYNELKNYTDDEIYKIINNKFPILVFNITEWDYSDGLYYYDIEHNKNNLYPIVNCWYNNELIRPLKVENTNWNTVRIWMRETKDLQVAIL